MFVLKRKTRGGEYVAKPGHRSSYAKNIKYAQRFSTREAAEANRCIESEVIVSLEPIFNEMRAGV